MNINVDSILIVILITMTLYVTIDLQKIKENHGLTSL